MRPHCSVYTCDRTSAQGITYFDGDVFLAKAPAEEVDPESDCDNDSIEAEDSTEEGNRGARVVLSPGSHSA